MIELILGLDIAIGLGMDIQNQKHGQQENPIGVIQIEHKLTKDISLEYYHSSSLKDGLKTDKKDINNVIFKVKLW